MTAEERISELGIELPTASAPVANYVMTRQSGNLLFVSGHVSKRDGAVATGSLGQTIARDDGYALARSTMIDVLASVRAALGSLDRVSAVVKLTGFVNSTSTFTEQPFVVNGASDLLVEVFGDECGRHARAAVGVAQLPLGAAVELEAIFEVR